MIAANATVEKKLQRVLLRFPNAIAVSVMGEFNNWSNIETPLVPAGPELWELHIKHEAELRQLCFFVWDHGMLYGRMVAEASLVRVPDGGAER